MTTMAPPIILHVPSDEVVETAWRRMTRRPLPLLCLVVVALYGLIGIASFTPFLNQKIDEVAGGSYDRPQWSKVDLWLGTDVQGRPVLWRLLYGTRVALILTTCASILSLSIGVVLGVLAGFYGGWIDEVITWLFTTVNSVPWILLVIAFDFVLQHRTFFGHEVPELVVVIFALGLTDWVGICRLIRSEVFKHRDRDYVYAARAAGIGDGRILFRHILPNVLHLVIITFSLGAVTYVQAEVVLTFLGLGISSKPSWGRMIDDSKLELMKGVWWQLAAATVAIAILCLALNILGDELRDALDPRVRGTD